MRKSDCRNCVCLIEEHTDGTWTWLCDEVNKKIKDIKVCPEGMPNTKDKRRKKKC